MTDFLKNYLYNIGVSLSQFANVILLAGDPDETISSRIGKSIAAGGIMSKVALPQWFADHCIRSMEKWEGKNSAWLRRERV